MKTVFPEEFRLKDWLIGPGHPCLIIAEAGVNHFGDMERARRLVDLAAEGKADVFKIQVYKTENFISSRSADWVERMQAKELPYDQVSVIKEYAESKGMMFIASAHDAESLDFLVKLGAPAIKIGSGEKQNFPYFKKAGSYGLPVFLSTGMSTLEEVTHASQALADGGCKALAILHCVTLYPTEPAEVNLLAMDSIRDSFKVPTGYSDHTIGEEACWAAVARGANVIEKHIALEAHFPNTWDPIVSCTPQTLLHFTEGIRRIEKMLGSKNKRPTERELQSVIWATKSMVAAGLLKKGEVLSEIMIAYKRPGNGLPPTRLTEILGKRLKRNVKADEIIYLNDLE